MTLIKLSDWVTDARGTQQGATYKKGRYGRQRINKPIPLNPNTARQAQARARFTNNSTAWRSLTQVQRDSWTSAAPNFPVKNKLGDLVTPPGNVVYQSVNNVREMLGQTVLTLPPNFSSAPIWGLNTVITADMGTQSLYFTYADTPPVNGVNATVLSASPLMSAGINNPGTQFRQLTTIFTYIAPPAALNFGAAYNATWGALSVGYKLFVDAVNYVIATGKPSQTQRYFCIVTP